MSAGTKVCPKCAVEKDVDTGFYRRTLPSGTVTTTGWCKDCMNEARRDRQKRALNALRILEAEGRA